MLGQTTIEDKISYLQKIDVSTLNQFKKNFFKSLRI